MGGGGDHAHGHGDASHGDFRTKVWSMTGGPYCRPVHWKRNTAIAMVGIFLVCIPIAIKSAELEMDAVTFLLAISTCNMAGEGGDIQKFKNYLVLAIVILVLNFQLIATDSGVYSEQRPQIPNRPIPSQIWCKNFGKEY
ncbi:hypothetical protein GIB67_009612 [Kingdonia uniflora]|uniref:Uncharacterized protein n=1 Tax=Kingdonia uniflora TaxID=39325 RepID=A0A7J7M2A2_9MAGN|nr:hypothetical protein GIB67_009612 [Kingdonia uniflora]